MLAAAGAGETCLRYQVCKGIAFVCRRLLPFPILDSAFSQGPLGCPSEGNCCTICNFHGEYDTFAMHTRHCYGIASVRSSTLRPAWHTGHFSCRGEVLRCFFRPPCSRRRTRAGIAPPALFAFLRNNLHRFSYSYSHPEIFIRISKSYFNFYDIRKHPLIESRTISSVSVSPA